MHEISLVRNIFRTLEATFSPEELSQIEVIHLKVGLLSNVEPTLMQNAFEAVTATEQPGFQNSRLQIEVLPIQIHCADCNLRSDIQNYKFVCSRCGRPNNNVVQGMELLISKVVFDSN